MLQRQTDKTTRIMAPCTHPGTIREVNEGRRPHTCRRSCAFEEGKNTKKSTAPKTHNEIHSNPATATNSTQHATKHAPRVSPYSPASIDPGFVEIGLVHLSQSVKTTNVTHAHTDRQTDRQAKKHADRQKDRQTDRQADRYTDRLNK